MGVDAPLTVARLSWCASHAPATSVSQVSSEMVAGVTTPLAGSTLGRKCGEKPMTTSDTGVACSVGVAAAAGAAAAVVAARSVLQRRLPRRGGGGAASCCWFALAPPASNGDTGTSSTTVLTGLLFWRRGGCMLAAPLCSRSSVLPMVSALAVASGMHAPVHTAGLNLHEIDKCSATGSRGCEPTALPRCGALFRRAWQLIGAAAGSGAAARGVGARAPARDRPPSYETERRRRCGSGGDSAGSCSSVEALAQCSAPPRAPRCRHGVDRPLRDVPNSLGVADGSCSDGVDAARFDEPARAKRRWGTLWNRPLSASSNEHMPTWEFWLAQTNAESVRAATGWKLRSTDGTGLAPGALRQESAAWQPLLRKPLLSCVLARRVAVLLPLQHRDGMAQDCSGVCSAIVAGLLAC